MTELSPDAENLIATAGGGDEPSALDAERVRTKLAARLALAAATATTAATAPAQAIPVSTAAVQTASSSSSLIAAGAGAAGAGAAGAGAAGAAKAGLLLSSSKLILAMAVGGGTAVLGAPHLLSNPSDGSVGQAVATSSTVRSAAPLNQPAPLNQTAPLKPANSPLPEQDNRVPTNHELTSPSATRKTASTVRPRAPEPSPSSPDAVRWQTNGASFPPLDSVSEEAALLRQARAALASGATTEADQLLEQHRVLFPRGALIEERMATQVMAQCANGRNASTDRRAAEFLSAYPRSPLANPVRRACAGNELQNESVTDPKGPGH